jgi:hypothetical protein
MTNIRNINDPIDKEAQRRGYERYLERREKMIKMRKKLYG